MALTLLPLSGTYNNGAKATIYTVPAATTAFIIADKSVNNNASAQIFNLYIKLAAGTSKHMSAVDQSLPAKGRADNLAAGQGVDTGGLIEGDANATNVEYAITLLLVT